MSDPAARPSAAVVAAVRRQIEDCRGSPLYVHVLRVVLDDIARSGPSSDVFAAADPDADPWSSAVPLRFLGALHRLVLTARAPALAAHYPSVGGHYSDASSASLAADALDTIAMHTDELRAGLARPVQTNEVGRSAALVGGFHRVAGLTGRPLRLLEIGASAGLNLGFDRYAYEVGERVFGDPASPVRLRDPWLGDPPPLSPLVRVAERRGCDRHPIDPRTAEGRLTLQSFVWADQVERLTRLRAALELASERPVLVERAEADAWLEAALAEPAPGLATVVFHSSVQQYLSPEAAARVRAALVGAGRRATPTTSIHWLRMEPGDPIGPRAEVRSTSWTGTSDDGRDELIATSGYHGPPVQWLAAP